MNVKLAFTPASRNPADLLVVVLDDEKTLHEIDDPTLADHVRRAAEGLRAKALKREYFTTLPDGGPARALVVYWSPQLKGWNLWENVKTFTARALRLARDYRLPRVALALNGRDGAPLVGKATEGALLGSYVFDRYRSEKDEFLAREATLTILAHPDHQADAEARRARYAWVAENVNRARDLINEPGNVVTPESIASDAGEIAREVELEVEVLDAAALRARGYQGILRVGAGSVNPGRMVVLRHVPRKASGETLALVGKGITFDSGGISIKPGDKMWEMKGDMAGAAAVLFAMRALGRLRPELRVIGILCCAENLPDANAQRPGDIFTAKNGKSVMVDNTDAEGRLVLTDGLARAGEEGATHVVDIATLTGAVVRALGPSVAGVMGTDRELVRRVIASGENHGESFWELPLVEEYRDSLKTPYADINNIAQGGLAGAITAGLFLREFVPSGAAWAHLDIAGPMFKDKEWKYFDAGAIGFGVKTLVDLCERFRDPVA
ncbi:MAG TPA: leucyl aminopeptidase [Vicinamibacteria bacterium]|nr:leucyl aminopeptidase [Vicinamibacteria bacterium]